MGRLANFGQNNKRGRCKSPKLINNEVGINGEAAKTQQLEISFK